MLGGALLAYLLGPRLVARPEAGGKRAGAAGGSRALLAVKDEPPLPWFAFQPAPGPGAGTGGTGGGSAGPLLPKRSGGGGGGTGPAGAAATDGGK